MALQTLQFWLKLLGCTYSFVQYCIARSQTTAQAIVRKYRTSVKYTCTTDEMATSYRTSTTKFRTMPSYCVVRSYDSLWRFHRTFTLILRSYDSLWGRRTIECANLCRP